VAAGIGGGSADAGAALRAVRRANPELGERVDWSRIAASLGADVPVCFRSQPAYMSGVGERIEAVAGLARLDVVLVNPLVAVPPKKTALVFRLLQAAPMTADCGAERRDVSVRSRAALIDLMRQTGNDLLAPALKVVPAIADVMAALHGTLDVELAQLSGAGPTCFGVYPGRSAANEAAKRLRREYPDWWIEAASIG
jgi:4-diphosphocytidyl-2-C-methyl-D-erythritol kinase